jgi:hypothetical protein
MKTEGRCLRRQEASRRKASDSSRWQPMVKTDSRVDLAQTWKGSTTSQKLKRGRKWAKCRQQAKNWKVAENGPSANNEPKNLKRSEPHLGYCQVDALNPTRKVRMIWSICSSSFWKWADSRPRTEKRPTMGQRPKKEKESHLG